MTEQKCIDETALERLRAVGGRKLVRQMIDLFLSNAPERIEAARSGEKAGDLRAVERAAHSLRASAANFGANVLYELAGEIERLALENRGDKISSLLRDLEEAFAQVKTRLEEEKKGLEE